MRRRCYDSNICGVWLIYAGDHASYARGTMSYLHVGPRLKCVVGRDSLICVPWLAHICDRTQFMYFWEFDVQTAHKGTWLKYVWEGTHLYVRHDTWIFWPWLVNVCDVTHSYVRNDSCVIWHIRGLLKSQVPLIREYTTHMNESYAKSLVRDVTHVWYMRDNP